MLTGKVDIVVRRQQYPGIGRTPGAELERHLRPLHADAALDFRRVFRMQSAALRDAGVDALLRRLRGESIAGRPAERDEVAGGEEGEVRVERGDRSRRHDGVGVREGNRISSRLGHVRRLVDVVGAGRHSVVPFRSRVVGRRHGLADRDGRDALYLRLLHERERHRDCRADALPALDADRRVAG